MSQTYGKIVWPDQNAFGGPWMPIGGSGSWGRVYSSGDGPANTKRLPEMVMLLILRAHCQRISALNPLRKISPLGRGCLRSWLPSGDGDT